jgi:Raf kinase inhibitor-like YbhB/YbcL family protein
MDDPDAPSGTWVHWVLYDLPASMRSLPEDVAKTAGMANFVEGANSWGRTGYGGPCPPRGTHRYFIRLYALDATLSLQPGATKDRLLKAMQGHILAGGELMGTYSR